MVEVSNAATGTVETDEVLVRLATIARRYDIPRSTLTYWIRTKRLPACRLGRTYRVRDTDVRKLLRPAEPKTASR